jgi:hypothetical protein
MNKTFKTIFIKKIILICESFTEIWKSDILMPELGSRTYFVILELWISPLLFLEDLHQDVIFPEGAQALPAGNP